MADFLSFSEGEQYLLTHGDGLPSTCYFALSTNAVDSMTAATTLVGGFGELPTSATGYARQFQASPTPAGGVVTFAQMSWNTGSATNWSNSVKSVVLCTSSSRTTGQIVAAWNLQAGGVGRDMSPANTTENVIVSFTLASVVTTVVPPGPGPGPTPPGEDPTYDNLVLQSGPVFYLTGDTQDKSGKGHSIQNNGAQAVVQLPNNGKAWQFDSSGTQYLMVPDPVSGDLSINTSGVGFTVECWYQTSALNQPHFINEEYVNFLGKDDFVPNTSSNGVEWEFRYYSQDTTDTTGNGPFGVCAYAFNAVGGFGAGHDNREAKTTNTWYHMVGVYDTRPSSISNGAGQMVSYPNGYVQLYHGSPSQPTRSWAEPIGATWGPGPCIDTFTAHSSVPLITPTHTGSPFTIGTTGLNMAGSNPFWYGAIGKVAVYPKVLDAATILSHYNTMMTPSSNQTPAPAVTSLSPNHGAAGGGYQVIVTGTALSWPTNVYFNGVDATNVVSPNDTTITCNAPAGTAGNTIDVIVKTTAGQSVGSTGSKFTYNSVVTPPGGSPTAYDTRILQDHPVLYLDGSTATSNQWGGKTYTINNSNGVGTTTMGIGGNNALTFNGTNQMLFIPDPSDGSLSINTTGALSIEAWVQLNPSVNMLTTSPGLEGGTDIITKCLESTPPNDTNAPLTDGNEWAWRYFNDAAHGNTNVGSNPAGDFCGYAFNKGGTFGAGWDDHMLDGSGGTTTNKTPSMWVYMCIVYDMTNMTALYGTNYQYGGVSMFCGVQGYAGTDTYALLAGKRRQTAPMYVSWASAGPPDQRPIVPSHTTSPLTIGSGGWTSHTVTPPYYWQGTQSGFAPGWFHGNIAKLAIYNYALTQTITTAHFAAMV